jgi:hypothetical protein
MPLVQLLSRPSNFVCDRFGLTDEHERGMMRMFVNMGLLSGVCVVIFVVAWPLLS